MFSFSATILKMSDHKSVDSFVENTPSFFMTFKQIIRSLYDFTPFGHAEKRSQWHLEALFELNRISVKPHKVKSFENP